LTWKTQRATKREVEILASYIFDQRLAVDQELFGDKAVFVMTHYAKRCRKPKDDRIRTRQIQFPDRPAVVQPPIEARPRRTDMFRQQYLDEEGKLCIYDPTKRTVRPLPEVQAGLEGHPEGIECLQRTIHWTIILGQERTIILDGMPLLENATEDNVMTKLGVAMNRPKMNPKYVKFTPSRWQAEGELRVDFDFQRRRLKDLKRVELAELKRRFKQEHMILIETDRACSGNADHKDQEDGERLLQANADTRKCTERMQTRRTMKWSLRQCSKH
jgi:hypothetical protein